jgi:hypothetical protein
LVSIKTLVVVAAFLALAPGCGTEAGEREAGRSVERFFAAMEARDGAAACALLSESASSALETSERTPCDRAVLSLGVTPAGVEAASVWVTSAKVDLRDGDAAFLDQIRGAWRIGALGCRPQRGKPYECELEG